MTDKEIEIEKAIVHSEQNGDSLVWSSEPDVVSDGQETSGDHPVQGQLEAFETEKRMRHYPDGD